MKLALCTQIPTLYYPPPSSIPSIWGHYDSWLHIPMAGRPVLNDIHLTSSPMDTDIKNNGYDFSCSRWIVHQINFHGTVCENHKESGEGEKSRVLVAPDHGTRGIYSPCSVFIYFFSFSTIRTVSNTRKVSLKFIRDFTRTYKSA